MDNKVSVSYCAIALSVAIFASVSTLGLIAVGLLHMRYTGIGLIALATSVSLYLRGQIMRLVGAREEAAFRLGRASHQLEHSGLHSVQ